MNGHYEAVLENWEDLSLLLAGGPDQILLSKFKEKGWVTGPGPDPDVRGMINIALKRISSNVSHYNTFIGMLQDIPQAKNVMEAMRGMYSITLVLRLLRDHWECE